MGFMPNSFRESFGAEGKLIRYLLRKMKAIGGSPEEWFAHSAHSEAFSCWVPTVGGLLVLQLGPLQLVTLLSN